MLYRECADVQIHLSLRWSHLRYVPNRGLYDLQFDLDFYLCPWFVCVSNEGSVQTVRIRMPTQLSLG